MNKPQFIIAAPTSNAGKTTVTLGLLRALKKQGHQVMPFKSGPDYIDPKFHRLASGQTSINLDLYMMPTEDLKQCYQSKLANADMACIEGVMGLFDGARKSQGSTAELAKTLDLPVILVVDAKSVAYSVAPLLYGFKNFDPAIKIAGVIFNRVNTQSHYQFLQEACEDVDIKALGHLPVIPEAEIPSRHLGLSIANINQFDSKIEAIATAIEQHIDLKGLLESCQSPTFSHKKNTTEKASIKTDKKAIVAIAKDEAFNFIYPQNIDTLSELGKIVYFSPLKDQQLPTGSQFVYLPGGYPECYLKELSKNKTMHQSISDYIEQEGKLLAECGGLMYLGENIIDKDGKTYPMIGAFPFDTSMKDTKLHLGYRNITLNGTTLKGHEFHYSTLIEKGKIPHKGNITNARNTPIKTKIYQKKQTIATYIHLLYGPIHVSALYKSDPYIS